MVIETVSLCLSVTALVLFVYILINRFSTRSTVSHAKKGNAYKAD